MSRVSQLEYCLSDNLTCRLGAEADALIPVGRDNGELLDYVPAGVVTENFSSRNKITDNAIEIGAKNCLRASFYIHVQDGECVPPQHRTAKDM